VLIRGPGTGKSHIATSLGVQAVAELDRDIARMRGRWRPSETDLAGAPTIVARQWAVSQSPGLSGLHLCGVMLDGEGRRFSRDWVTNLVIAVDTKAGTWARTLNRFYRLAHPETDHEQ
jgi:hypothetical protein